MPPDRDAVDLRNLLEACGTGEHDSAELLREIVGHLVRQNTERLALARAALGEQNRVALAQLAHAIKGSAALVGAEGLSDIARALERDAETAPAEALDEAVTAMAEEFESVLAALRRLRPDLIE